MKLPAAVSSGELTVMLRDLTVRQIVILQPDVQTPLSVVDLHNHYACNLRDDVFLRGLMTHRRTSFKTDLSDLHVVQCPELIRRLCSLF